MSQSSLAREMVAMFILAMTPLVFLGGFYVYFEILGNEFVISGRILSPRNLVWSGIMISFYLVLFKLGRLRDFFVVLGLYGVALLWGVLAQMFEIFWLSWLAIPTFVVGLVLYAQSKAG